MAAPPNPVARVVAAAGGSVQKLADLWKLSREAIYGFERQGFLPLDRALDARDRFDIPLRDLVRPELQVAIDAGVQDHLLSD